MWFFARAKTAWLTFHDMLPAAGKRSNLCRASLTVDSTSQRRKPPLPRKLADSTWIHNKMSTQG